VSARLAAVLLLALAAGCSAVGFAYNNADTWLRWQAGRYLDLDSGQTRELDARVDAFLAWHRTEALPRYARLAGAAVSRLERGASRDDLVWGYDAIREQSRAGLRRAGAELGDFLDRLTPAQIAHLEERFAQENRKYAERWLAGTPAQRRERRYWRIVEVLEDWLGELNDAQRERIRQYSESAPLNAEGRDRDRRRLQAELLAMLRAGASAGRVGDWAAHWERGRDPGFAAANRAAMQDFIGLLADLEQSLSPGQRQHAVRRLRGYARDFQVLAEAR
jgi:hypothetical protein